MKIIEVQLRRKLVFELDGKLSEGAVTLGPLVQEAPGKPWTCECHISKVVETSRRIYGEDELHAFANGLAFCRDALRDFDVHNGRVWWLEQGDQGGL